MNSTLQRAIDNHAELCKMKRWFNDAHAFVKYGLYKKLPFEDMLVVLAQDIQCIANNEPDFTPALKDYADMVREFERAGIM